MREAPLCKGSWHGEAVTEGLCSKMLCICIYLGEEGLLYHRIDILINAGKIPVDFLFLTVLAYISTLVCNSI